MIGIERIVLAMALAGSDKAPSGSELPRAIVGASALDTSSGDVWVGTLGAGLFRFSAGRVDQFTQFNSGLAGDLVLDVAVWSGLVFCATNAGLSRLDPRQETWGLYFERRGSEPQTVIVELVVGKPSALYAHSSTGEHFRYDPTEDRFRAVDALPRRAGPAPRDGAFVPGRLLDGSAPERPAAGGAVALGLLVPAARTIAVPDPTPASRSVSIDRQSVEQAVADAHARHAAGRPAIELSSPLLRFARQGFGTPEDSLAMLALRPEVLGVVGYLDPDARVEKVLAERLELPLVDAAPAQGGPARDGRWVFHCDRDGEAAQAALVDALLAAFGRPRLAVVRTPGRDAAARVDIWVRRASERGNPVVLDAEWSLEPDALADLLARIRDAKVRVVLTWTDAASSARMLCRMREAGLAAAFVGGSGIVEEEFAKLAPPHAGTVLAAAPCSHAVPFQGEEASPIRVRSYLAAAHLLAALETAGPDRISVRDALERMRDENTAVFADGAWRIVPARAALRP